MKEIFVEGNVKEDFKRCGVEVRETYKGKRLSIYEVTKEELKILDNDNEPNSWKDGCTRWNCKSNMGKVKNITLVNGRGLQVWAEYETDDETGEEYINQYRSLTDYLEMSEGCSKFINICALSSDLAKQNGMRISELFNKYEA